MNQTLHDALTEAVDNILYGEEKSNSSHADDLIDVIVNYVTGTKQCGSPCNKMHTYAGKCVLKAT